MERGRRLKVLMFLTVLFSFTVSGILLYLLVSILNLPPMWFVVFVVFYVLMQWYSGPILIKRRAGFHAISEVENPSLHR